MFIALQSFPDGSRGNHDCPRPSMQEQQSKTPWEAVRDHIPRRQIPKVLATNLKRCEHRLRLQRERIAAERQSVAAIWSRTCLARGTRLSSGLAAKRTRGNSTWQHSKAWTLAGCLCLAFGTLNCTIPDAVGQRRSRRELDAVSAVALAHTKHVDASVETTFLHVRHKTLERRPTQGFFFARSSAVCSWYD